MISKTPTRARQKKRQRIRLLILLISFLLLPITIFYFSPALIVTGAFEGVVAGSMIMFALQFLFALIFGRAFCGWLCPAGGLQELEAMAVGKPSKLGWRTRIKYVIWVPWIVSIVVGACVVGGFSVVDPLYHTEGGISVSNLMGLAIYFGIVGLFFIPNLFLGRRAMCHCICWMAPFMVLGQKLGRLLHVPQMHIGAQPGECISCGKCTETCPMSLDVETLLQEGAIRDAECIQCAACADTCPKDVLRLQIGRTGKRKI